MSALPLQRPRPRSDALMTPSEVAKLFRVTPKTVGLWEMAGRISAIKTLGGHRRYRREEIMGYYDTTVANRISPAQA